MTLRTRFLLALLATSVVTLGVAALALLQPLQDRPFSAHVGSASITMSICASRNGFCTP